MTESRTDTGAGGRNSKGQFARGVSGNPKGRPPKPPELKRMARESLPRLWEIAQADKTPARVRAQIYMWIYEQQYGKAVQAVTGEDGAPIVRVVMDEVTKDYAV